MTDDKKVAPWASPRFVGDAVRRTRLERDGEIGEVVIRVFPAFFDVCSFLPGRSEGELRVPDFAWSAQTKEGADHIFDDAVRSAKVYGWRIVDPPT